MFSTYDELKAKIANWMERPEDQVAIDDAVKLAEAWLNRQIKPSERYDLQATDTNWLSENHPDVYFAACMVWGGLNIVDLQQVETYRALLAESVPDIAHEVAKAERDNKLKVDPMLLSIGKLS